MRLDTAPLVDAPRRLHEQRLDGDAGHCLEAARIDRALDEREIALRPAHQLKDGLFRLRAHAPLELATRDRLDRDQNLTQPARVARLLEGPCPGQVLFAQLAGALQQLSERMRIARNMGRDHGPPLEVDHPGILAQLRGDAQRSGLPPQVEELEDIVNIELPEWSLDRHVTPPR